MSVPSGEFLAAGPQAAPESLPTHDAGHDDAAAWANADETLSLPEIEEPSERRSRVVAKQTSHRDDIVIPDYTLIKRIGAGAYGEVWLAQSVTGALRAVKIVWREDFELTKTFHREFIGIQQFEPISRGHPGLVHILHVGWNEKRGFYYCVMELADDAVTGPDIQDLQAYEPRTLGTDMKAQGRLDLHFCQEAGAFIADALHFMHAHGLTHRDIKPSNIIFVHNTCKLADIGLVAGFGERTYVGTEGFVPPEGPGTAQADLYSLGKVLYEMTTGKDRMEFPEIPEDISEDEWPFWKELNRVICRACAPDLKERYQTCEQFAADLRKVGAPRPERLTVRIGRFARAALVMLFISACAGGLLAAYKSGRDTARWTFTSPIPKKPVVKPLGPQPPVPGKPWQNRLSQWFSFNKDRHVADVPVDYTTFKLFLDMSGRSIECDFSPPMKVPGHKDFRAVMVPPADATAFCEWLTATERETGRLTVNQEYGWSPVSVPRTPGFEPRDPSWTAINCEIVKSHYGSVAIDSTPRGADVFDGDRLIGRTPLSLPRVHTGAFEYEVRFPGYKPELAKGKLQEGQSTSFNLRLKASGAVVFGKTWQNSLAMKFEPLGQAMIAVHEVRRQDFAAFAKAAGLPPVENRALDADMRLPVTFVNRKDAEDFCRWLTDTEREKGLLDPAQEYALPSDDAWSMAAYLPRERGDSPSERNLRIGSIYTWGFIWPPTAKTGNFFGRKPPPKNAKDAKGEKEPKGIEGFEDGYEGPAPVSSFSPDSRKLFDLSGNVWEWIAEPWGGDDEATRDHGVVRGGAFTTEDRTELLASYRRHLPANSRLPDVGFRIMLIEDGKPARAEE
ncbi:MAG: SUMF1/EgtB/PvdO family nonheme iron enzyme [Verrucomicrobiaceae bacterium]|nr:SUMF1/EgtB/PvdO family nonheme iron enzyme [Verrucomicrobiaceae bacterium]